MEWKAVSRDVFQTILDEEIAELLPETAAILRLHTVPIFEKPCIRDAQHGTERVFVVAQNGTRLLFYDDVEEEFAVEVPDTDGVLRRWGTHAGLGVAVLALGADGT